MMWRARHLLAACVLLVPAAAMAQPHPPPADEAAPEEAPPPKLVVKGFGNVDFRDEFDGPRTLEFSLGQLDLFVTSALTDNLTFLAEIVFEPGDEEKVVDVERYQIQYSRSDLFNVALGRMHTMLGHWNHAYHHGTWFQTTAFRPEVYRFEDEGGVLPVHELGLRMFGSRAFGRNRMEYSVSLANGRGPVASTFENFRDFNRSKAFTAWLALTPAPLPGLKFGGVVRSDRIPPDPADPARAVSMTERIVGGFFTYQRRRTEVLGEVLALRHREEGGTGREFGTSGFYVQASHRFGRLTPYYRFEGLDRGADDPYYPSSADLRRHIAGLRADPWSSAAVKVELSRDAPDPGPSFSAATLQVAFTF